LNVEVADWQRTLCSIAEDAPLQLQISWSRFIAFHMVFGEDPERACDKIAGIAHEFALHRTLAVRHRSCAVPSIAGNVCGLREYASIHSVRLSFVRQRNAIFSSQGLASPEKSSLCKLVKHGLSLLQV
jgi:hypothetical protein